MSAVRNISFVGVFLTTLATLVQANPSIGLQAPRQFRQNLADLPHSNSYAALLDQIVPATVWLLDESAGFSEVDHAKFSVWGDSWIWNRWYLDGFDISDPVYNGDALIKVPVALMADVRVAHASVPGISGERGLYLESKSDLSVVLAGSQVQAGHVGDIWRPAKAIMDFSSGSHSRNRAGRPASARRHLRHPVLLYGVSQIDTENWLLTESVQWRQSNRSWVDFGPVIDDTSVNPPALSTYEEAATVIYGGIVAHHHRRHLDAGLHLQYSDRHHLGAELYRANQETAQLSTMALLATLKANKLGFNSYFKSYDLTPVDQKFSKDLKDPDGQELNPWQPGGRTFAYGIRTRFEHSFFYLNARQDMVSFRPAERSWRNPVLFSGASYGGYSWRSERSTQFLGDIRAGVSDEIAPRAMVLSYDAWLAGMWGLNTGGRNQIGFVDPGVSFRLEFLKPKRITPFLQLAKAPVGLNTHILRAIDPDYLNGSLHANATGAELENRGGTYTKVSPSLRPTNVYTVATGLEKTFRDNWSYRLQGMVNFYQNTFELQFDGPAELYGYEVSGVYYFKDGENRYVLKNRSQGSPVYYGMQMQLLGDKTDLYIFSWSFAAYNVVGTTPFGNGPTTNDQGVVDFSSANPNSRLRGNANLDSDRAFNTKILTGTRIFQGLWWMAALTHYDGTPFAPYDIHQHNGQVARTYNQHRGSPGTFVGPLIGAREDYRLNVDLQLQYKKRLNRVQIRTWWLLANLLDFGNEIVELQSQAGRDHRLALEQEIPRSFEFGLEIAGN